MLKAGYYKGGIIVDPKNWTENPLGKKYEADLMAEIYQRDNSKMPSPIWCVWNDQDPEKGSIFNLDGNVRSEVFYKGVMSAMRIIDE